MVILRLIFFTKRVFESTCLLFYVKNRIPVTNPLNCWGPVVRNPHPFPFLIPLYGPDYNLLLYLNFLCSFKHCHVFLGSNYVVYLLAISQLSRKELEEKIFLFNLEHSRTNKIKCHSVLLNIRGKACKEYYNWASVNKCGWLMFYKYKSRCLQGERARKGNCPSVFSNLIY